jgi:hypothetical protein
MLILAVLACNTGGGSSGSAADTTAATTASTAGDTTAATTASTSGDTTDGFGGACAVAGVACESALDCCETAPPGSGCPNTFPVNYTCEAGTCVQGGCTSQADCADLYTGMSCITVGSKGFCVVACEDDQDCLDHNMHGTVCFDNPAGDYCRQP